MTKIERYRESERKDRRRERERGSGRKQEIDRGSER